MSAEFIAANNEETEVTISLPADSYTAVIAVLPDSSRSHTAARAITMDNGAGFTVVSSLYFSTTDIILQFRSPGPLNDTESIENPINTSSWTYVCWGSSGATNFNASVDGSSVFSNEAYDGSVDMTGETLTRLVVGGRAGAAQDHDGFVAYLALWDAELSADAYAALSSGASPLIYPTNLYGYWPLTSSLYADTLGSLTLADVTDSPSLVTDNNPPHLYPE